MPRTHALLVTASLLFAASPAFAADVIDTEPVPPAPPVQEVQAFTWGGAFFGGSLGYLTGDADVLTAPPLAPDVDGFLAGIFAGYNWQFDNNIVVGIEGGIDYSFADIDLPAGAGSGDVEWLATVGPRVGYTIDNVLLFAEGGYAAANLDVSSGGLSDDATHNGYFVGAGLDYAINETTFAGIKYNYLEFSDETYALGGGPTVIDDASLHSIKARIGVKF